MLNFGSKTLIPETTLQRPGIVNDMWLSYCPGLFLLKRGKRKLVVAKVGDKLEPFCILYKQTNLPAISWYVLVMMKSAAFIAIKSAVNWHEKWYFGSNDFQLTSESSYLVFSKA